MARYLLDPFSFVGGGGYNFADAVTVTFTPGGVQATASGSTFQKIHTLLVDSDPTVTKPTIETITASETIVGSFQGSLTDATPTITEPTVESLTPSETLTPAEDGSGFSESVNVVLVTTAESKLLLLL